MTNLAHIESLARDYKQRAETSGKWTDYVQAHGLANFCVVKDSTEDRRKLVYNIEESWYKGRHPLSYDEHQQLIEKHKSLLQNYRSDTRDDFIELKAEADNFDPIEIFSDKNMNFSKSFSRQIFAASEKCSKQLVEVSKCIISSSIDLLQLNGLAVPCKFAVLGLGSIAKGEATPYSDLEYAFIVEREDAEYFEHLAVDSYFRIGNLGETPLKYFDIKEIRIEKKSQHITVVDVSNSFEESLLTEIAAGYRIDGLMEKAGNIPTGNGRDDSQALTLTVDAYMELYKSSAEAPLSEKKSGDLSGMLASSVVMYTNEGETSQLYAEFVRARMAYEFSSEHAITIGKKRFTTFAEDVYAYEFLPKFVRFQPPKNMNIEIKTEIFRYPTLLANNIKMLLRLNDQHSWESFSHLHKEGMLSDENYQYINIVLALSIYMRTSAYVSYDSQTESMSLVPTIVPSPKYNVPAALFVLYGSLLTPIKQSVMRVVDQITPEEDPMKKIATSISENLRISTTDFWHRAEVCYFAGQYHLAKEELATALTMSIESVSPDEVVQAALRADDHLKPAQKFVQLCCYILYHTGSYASAAIYLQWIISSREVEGIGLLLLLKAHCMKEVGNYQKSQELLAEAEQQFSAEESCGKESHVADSEQHQDTYINYNNIGNLYEAMGEYEKALSNYGTALHLSKAINGEGSHPHTAACLSNIGNIHGYVGSYSLSLEYHNKSLDMEKALYGATTNHYAIATSYNDIGNVYTELAQYELALQNHTKSLDMRKAIYGGASNHLDIAISYNNIARVHKCLGNYTKSLDYYTESLHKKMNFHGAMKDHRDIALSYNNIGNVHSSLGNYKSSLEFHKKSLDMRQAIYGATSNHPEIAISYSNIGNAYRDLQQYSRSRECHDKSLDMKIAIYSETSNHPYIADSYNNIGYLYNDLGDNTLALKTFEKALDIKQAFHGANTNHPDIAAIYDNIGSAHLYAGDNASALKNYTKSRDMKTSIYGASANHPDIAKSYQFIGNAYGDLGKYSSSLEYHKKSLDMRKIVYSSITHHPDIASSYDSIGSVYSGQGKYRLALEYHNKALSIDAAIYGATTNHPNIAAIYNNIGNAYGDLGDHTSSLKYHNKSMNMSIAVYGATVNHQCIATSYNNIGIAHYDLANYTSALEYHNKSLTMKKALYGGTTNHLDIAYSNNNIGNVYRAMGDYESSLDFHNKSLVMKIAVFGTTTNHPTLATSYTNIANAHFGLGNHAASLDYHNKSLDMKQAIHGAAIAHPDIANSLYNIATIYSIMGNYELSLKFHIKSLDMRKTLFGKSTDHLNIAASPPIAHPDIANSLYNIATIYNIMGNYELSLKFHIKSIDMRKALYGESTDHPDIVASYTNIGNVHSYLGNYSLSLESFSKTLDLNRNLSDRRRWWLLMLVVRPIIFYRTMIAWFSQFG